VDHTNRRLLAPARALVLVTMALVILAVTSEVAGAQSAPGEIAGSVPSGGGFALVVWGGGTADALRTAAEARGCTLRSAFVTDARGNFVGYVFGAPAVVNAAFAGMFPSLNVPPNTPLIIVCAGPIPQAPTGPPRSITLVPALGGRNFGRPVEFGAYPGGRVYLAEQEGLVRLLSLSGGNEATFLDIRSQVSRASNEEGFLGLALDPGFPDRPYVYVYYSVAGGQRRTRLARFDVVSDAAVPASELVLIEVSQPFPNHKGGALRFGPDGMLYLGLGDGGSEGDPSGNGQNLGVLLAKVLRIDVRNASATQPYAVPVDNPFTGAGARGEVWAHGLRNPWRMSFDSATGALWLGDVGASTHEEVNVVTRGGNYGWNRMEGADCYQPRTGCDRSGITLPVASCTHASGCSITGGVVYRGAAIPALVGSYLYADFCSGRVWAVSVNGGAPSQVLGPDSARRVASFGTDAAGEVYLLIHGGAVQRIAGAQ
jgi:glucose/arabinose dehydrogenase